MNSTTTIKCQCGCGILSVERWTPDDKTEEYFLSYYMNVYYSSQHGFVRTMKERIIGAWKILTGKEYLFYDVTASRHEMLQFYDGLVSLLNNKWEREEK